MTHHSYLSKGTNGGHLQKQTVNFVSLVVQSYSTSPAKKSHIIWQPLKSRYHLATHISKMALTRAIRIYLNYSKKIIYLKIYDEIDYIIFYSIPPTSSLFQSILSQKFLKGSFLLKKRNNLVYNYIGGVLYSEGRMCLVF